VKVGSYRIDLVVEGSNDARLAIECDGDRYHGADRWVDDMQRQRVLERAGWVFWRCFASAYVRRRESAIAELLGVLGERGIEPADGDGVPKSVHCESRRVKGSEQSARGSHEDSVAEWTSQTNGAGNAEIAASATTGPELEPAAPGPTSRPSTGAAEETLDPQREESATAEATAVLERARMQSRLVAPHPGPYSDDALRGFLETHGLRSEDNRRNGGALWVLLDSERSPLARQLSAWAFKFKPGRGWWRK
jgi:hypothetical protein